MRIAGVFTVSPSSMTRPSAISFSASRREQMPARAITLAIRSPDSDGSSATWILLLSASEGVLCGDGSGKRTMNEDEIMELALAEAQAAAGRGEVPVGAVIVSADGQILARDGNRILERRDPTAHAEMLVMRA